MWYAKEGRPTLAGLSLLGMVPLIGNAKHLAKWKLAMEKLPAARKALAMAKGAPTKGVAYSTAYRLQQLFGTNRFVKGFIWKSLAKFFDDPDHPLGQEREGIMDIVGKATGDPKNPETQKALFDLADHMERSQVSSDDSDVTGPYRAIDDNWVAYDPSVVNRRSQETLDAYPVARTIRGLMDPDDNEKEEPEKEEDAYTKLRNFLGSSDDEEEKGKVGNHFTNLLLQAFK